MFLRFFFLSLVFVFNSNAYSNNTIMDLDAEVESFLRSKFENPNLDFEISYDSSSKIENLISSENSIKKVEFLSFSTSRNFFKILVLMEDLSKYTLYGRYIKYYKVPVAKHLVKAGSEIDQNDIKIVKLKKINTSQSIIYDLSKIIGKKTKIYIQPNNFFIESNLINPPLIKEGDVVTLEYHSGRIILKTSGVAVNSGAMGEAIKVKNEKSSIIVTGEIVGKNIVRVGQNAN